MKTYTKPAIDTLALPASNLLAGSPEPHDEEGNHQQGAPRRRPVVDDDNDVEPSLWD